MSQLVPHAGSAYLTEGRPGPGAHSDAHDFGRILRALRKRWQLFLIVSLGFVALVTLASLVMPKSYTTTVRLLAGRPGSPMQANGSETDLPVLNALVLETGVDSAETFAELAQQDDVATSVVQTLGLKTSPKALLSRVTVKPVVNTSMLALSVKWKNPDLSAQIANAFASAFVERERDFVRSQASAAIGYISGELPDARKELQATSARLAEFQSTHGFMDAATHAQSVVSRASSLDDRIDQLTVDASEAKALLANVQGQLAAMSTTVDSAKQVSENPVTAELQAKLADVNTQLAEGQKKYTAAYPALIALRQQRDALLAQINSQPTAVVSQTTVAPNPLYQSLQQQAAGYSARIQGDEGQLRALQSEQAAYRPAIRSMPEQAIEFQTIQEDARRASTVYDALEQKYDDALVARDTAIADIMIVQPASASDAVVSPNVRTNFAIALIVGILLGLAVVYVLDLYERRHDKTFVSNLGLPILARIPALQTTNPSLIPWLRSMTVEAFLQLCVTLNLGAKRSVKTLAVLSSRRGEGKSTVAYNLAKSLAMLQQSVLLIDADLREPTIHEKANCANAVGLNDVLAGTVPLEDAVQHLGMLDVLSARPEFSNPVLLLRTTFRTVLAEARAKYNLVIVDAPTLAVLSDALLIAAETDGSLFVVSADRTTEADTERALARLEMGGISNIVGIVVNRDAPPVSEYDDYFRHVGSGLVERST
ncbi:MAG TPA: polysaccharide biosynthesis tyrosine autokinase [Candidatus Acidoferrales bacterium]|nr:polysaccharide biosynthesis tyrosine autokinase [Candidatus Acidoferrales bacterium]